MIYSVDDTGSHILIKSALTSSGSATSAADGDGNTVTGVLNGTASASDFDSSLGFSPANGAVSFTNFANNGDLKQEGQISAEFTTIHCADADESGQVSGSQGDAKAASTYLFSFENSGGTDRGYVLLDATNAIRATPDGDVTYVTARINTRAHGSTVKVTLWWRGARWGVMADGYPIIEESNRGATAADFYKVIVGSSFNGTSSPFEGRIKNFVLSSKAPQYNTKQLINSIGIFGDSFANQQVIDTIPRYEGNVRSVVTGRMANLGWDIRRWIVDGNSGFTVCDTGASNLIDEIAAFKALQPTLAIVMAGNNDPTSGTQAQIDNSTTGTLARYKDIIQSIMFYDYDTASPSTPGTQRTMCEHVFITTARSLEQDDTNNTSAIVAKRDSVNAIINSLSDWWDTTYASYSGRVHIIDLFTLLGDEADNQNYQGYWTNLGNIGTGGSVSPGTLNDSHPSCQGYKVLGDAIADKIADLL